MIEPTRPTWTALSRHARAATAPEIDVRHAVLASLQMRRPNREPGFAEKLVACSHRWSVRLALSACVAITALIGYGGYHASEDLSVLVSFNF